MDKMWEVTVYYGNDDIYIEGFGEFEGDAVEYAKKVIEHGFVRYFGNTRYYYPSHKVHQVTVEEVEHDR